jgi:hypothetical protein
MKNMIKLCFIFSVAGIFFSCKKNISKVFYEGGTAPVLTANTAAVRLEAGEESNTAIRFDWTNPDYKFTTGISSHDVSYILEIDTAGANFGSSKKFSTSISNDLSKIYSVGELNAIFGNTMVLQLNPRRSYNFDARIISSIAPDAVKLTSNVFHFSASPFPPPPKVPVPTAGTLWIVGDAVNSGWSNPLPSPYDVTQKFTKLSSNTDYELIVDLKSTGGYKLIQTQGDWSTQYHMVTGGTALSGSFAKGDADPAFPAPSVAGTYKLSFNFQLGTYTVVKQ